MTKDEITKIATRYGLDGLGHIEFAMEIIAVSRAEKSREPTPLLEDIKKWWIENGGSCYGPHVETWAMPEHLLLPLIQPIIKIQESNKPDPHLEKYPQSFRDFWNYQQYTEHPNDRKFAYAAYTAGRAHSLNRVAWRYRLEGDLGWQYTDRQDVLVGEVQELFAI